VHLALSGPHCSAVLGGSGATANDGTAPFEYNNGPANTPQTAYGPGSGSLHAYQATGCRGMLRSGDVVRVFFGYDLSRAAPRQVPERHKSGNWRIREDIPSRQDFHATGEYKGIGSAVSRIR
jgi:hypothetical protein